MGTFHNFLPFLNSEQTDSENYQVISRFYVRLGSVDNALFFEVKYTDNHNKNLK